MSDDESRSKEEEKKKDSQDSSSNNPKPPECTVIKLPQLWTSNPDAWFITVEAQFKLNNVTKDSTKYLHVISSLPQEVAERCMDIIQNVPEQGQFQYVKQKIIERYSDSEDTRINKILYQAEIGDRKPSDFYLYLVQLANPTKDLGKELVRKIWLKKLPKDIEKILIPSSNIAIEQLIPIADKIWESNQSSSISSINSNTPPQFQEFQRQIDELKSIVSKISHKPRNYRRNRSKSRNRSRSRSKAKVRFQNTEYCWYHNTFGDKSTKCQEPCSYSKKSKDNSKK